MELESVDLITVTTGTVSNEAGEAISTSVPLLLSKLTGFQNILLHVPSP
jgi:hypothetical protein